MFNFSKLRNTSLQKGLPKQTVLARRPGARFSEHLKLKRQKHKRKTNNKITRWEKEKGKIHKNEN